MLQGFSLQWSLRIEGWAVVCLNEYCRCYPPILIPSYCPRYINIIMVTTNVGKDSQQFYFLFFILDNIPYREARLSGSHSWSGSPKVWGSISGCATKIVRCKNLAFNMKTVCLLWLGYHVKPYIPCISCPRMQ